MTNTQKDEARKLALEYLAERPSLAFRVSAICNGVKRASSIDIAEADMRDVLAVLESAGFAEAKRGKLSNEAQWQATAEGVLALEGGDL